MRLARKIDISSSSRSKQSTDNSYTLFQPSEEETTALRSVADNYDMFVYGLTSRQIKATRTYLRSLADGNVPTSAVDAASQSSITSFFRRPKYRVPSSSEISKFSKGRGLCQEVTTVLGLLETLRRRDRTEPVGAATVPPSLDEDLRGKPSSAEEQVNTETSI